MTSDGEGKQGLYHLGAIIRSVSMMGTISTERTSSLTDVKPTDTQISMDRLDGAAPRWCCHGMHVQWRATGQTRKEESGLVLENGQRARHAGSVARSTRKRGSVITYKPDEGGTSTMKRQESTLFTYKWYMFMYLYIHHIHSIHYAGADYDDEDLEMARVPEEEIDCGRDDSPSLRFRLRIRLGPKRQRQGKTAEWHRQDPHSRVIGDWQAAPASGSGVQCLRTWEWVPRQ